MTNIYLFDWGDTLMVDLKGIPGPMCNWEVVKTVDGAFETLDYLSKHSLIYIATGAEESDEEDIKKAFARVNLSQFISGYFCKTNLGVSKGEPDFLPRIIRKLGKPVSDIAMVGDNFDKDIKPALAVGIQPIWFSKSAEHRGSVNVQVISELQELCV
ncbi:MAG: HAD hydrolase-like protein [Exilibacterium sp.]